MASTRNDATVFADRRANSLPVSDYTVASGVFNVKLDAEVDEWTEYVMETISDAWRAQHLGIAFNMLTSYSDPNHACGPTTQTRRSSSITASGACRRHVALLHDYGLWEFTLLVRFDVAA